MLHFLRRAVKSIFAQILLGLLIVSFAVWGIGDIFRFQSDGAVAAVGDSEVSASRYADAILRVQRTLAQQRRAAVSLAELREAGIADATLTGLLRDAAFQEELGRLEIAIPTSAVREAIVSNSAFQDGQGSFSQFLYQSRLNEAGYNPETFEAAMRDSLGGELLAGSVAPAIVPPPEIGQMIAAHQGETRTIRFVRLRPETVSEPQAPSDAALQAFFEENPDRFVEPERRSGLYLYVDLATLAEETVPTEQEVRAEYDANLARYTAEAAREVEQLVFPDMASAEAAAERIRSGEMSFAEAAAEQNVSIANLSLGRVVQNDLPEATAGAVFGTTELGVIGPVEGPFGPVLLNITAVEPGGTAPFQDVADDIRDAIARSRARDLVAERADAIDDARASGVALAEIAEQIQGVELVRFVGLDPQGRVLEGAPPPLAADQAFLAEVGAALDGEERDLISLSDGSYALVLVEEIVDSHVPEFADVRDRVAIAWTEDQRMQALEAQAAELAGRMGEEGLEALAAEAGLDGAEALSFSRESVPSPLTAELADAVFAAEPGDPLVGRAAAGDAVLLGVLDAVEPLPEDELAARADALDQALVDSIERDQLEYFGRALEALHGAMVNRDMVAGVFEQLGQSGAN